MSELADALVQGDLPRWLVLRELYRSQKRSMRMKADSLAGLDREGWPLSGLQITGELADVRLNECDFSGTTVKGSIRDAIFTDCRLDRAILSGAKFFGVSLMGSSLRGADLTGLKIN